MPERQWTFPLAVSGRWEGARYPLTELGVQRFADRFSQLLGIEWLRQKKGAIFNPIPGVERLCQVTRNKHDFSFRALVPEPVRKKPAAHLWHDQIGQKQVDLPFPIRAEQPLRIIPICCFNDFVSEAPQDPNGHMPNTDIILQDED